METLSKVPVTVETLSEAVVLVEALEIPVVINTERVDGVIMGEGLILCVTTELLLIFSARNTNKAHKQTDSQ